MQSTHYYTIHITSNLQQWNIYYIYIIISCQGYYGRVTFGNHRRNVVVLRHRHRLQRCVISIADRMSE